MYYAWDGYKVIRNLDTGVNWKLLLFTIPLYILATTNSALIWAYMANIFGIKGKFFFHVGIYLSTLGARRLPGPYMNVLSRVGLYKYNGIDISKTAFVSGLEILMIIWTGIQAFLLSSIVLVKENGFPVGIIITGIILLSALFHPRAIHFFYKLITKGESTLVIRYKHIIILWCSYIIQWIIGTIFHVTLLQSIWPSSINMFYQVLLAWSASGVVGLLIGVLPSGLGISDFSLSIIISQYIPLSVASLLAIMSRALFTIYDVAATVVAIFLFKTINPKELLFNKKKSTNL